MLFYHIKLRCYVVVELKAVSFEPEFDGKLNFYVNAVNQLMKTDDDNPTIGLLICKDKDQTEVQWAFQGIETPMGVATYDNIRMNEIKSTAAIGGSYSETPGTGRRGIAAEIAGKV